MASSAQGKKKSAKPAAKKKAQPKKTPTEPKGEAKTFQWMKDTPEWGVRAQPGKRGLTLDDIAIGSYGDIPDRSEEMTRMPRGAFHVAGVPRLEFYPLSRKLDIWADNAGSLYE